jgi:hypothetical protein
MKEAIEELIERYKKRLKTLGELNQGFNDPIRAARLQAKESVYHDIIIELQCLLEDEQHET